MFCTLKIIKYRVTHDLRTIFFFCFSSREEPTKFPFYVGKMDQVMAAQLLTNQNIGTYLLRKNVKGDYRISAKQELKIKHLILSRQDGLYKNGSKSYESISDLIEEYRTPGKRYHLLFPYKKWLWLSKFGSWPFVGQGIKWIFEHFIPFLLFPSPLIVQSHFNSILLLFAM